MERETLNMEVAARLDGIGEYWFSTKLAEIDRMRRDGREVIGLGVGSPDLPPHPSVVEELAQGAARPDMHAYQPYRGAKVLRDAFARWYGERYGVPLDADRQVLPLIGSKEGLMHICMTYLNDGDEVLVPNPGYPTYRSAVTIAGGRLRDYELTEETGYAPDLEALEREGLGRVKIMILNYPHMPTGAQAPEGLFKEIVAFARRNGILLVHDNPYSFIRNPRPRSLMEVDGAMDVAVELNSLSKSHNMAGWRVGVMVAASERISEVIRFKSNMDSGMFLPMQAAAARALALDDGWYRDLNALYRSRERLGLEIMDALGCRCREGQAGLFLWGRLPEGYDGDCFSFSDAVLYDKGVFITPGGIFGSGGTDYVRISLCADEETLRRALAKIKG
ncbi:MAG: aminotransferase class I/II-fold pyridoxal phosphate-dependent enzyme [Alistipes sp.]|nr:aminotransferase class I/II-fold pyridoxal phosphate-dependent enzyme [Alistipes sp.]